MRHEQKKMDRWSVFFFTRKYKNVFIARLTTLLIFDMVELDYCRLLPHFWLGSLS